MEVIEIDSRPEFLELEEEWNDLAASTLDEPFHRHEFLRIWIDNFHPRAPLRVLTAREKGELVGALALFQEEATVFGAPVRQVVSFANDHTPRFDLLARDPPATAKAFFEHLTDDGSWQLLRINEVPEGGGAWHILEAAREAGFPVGTWASSRSPYVPLSPDKDQLRPRLLRKFLANVRRRRKKLERLGRVTLERVTGGTELPRALAEGFAVENSGWKGMGGSAIVQDPRTWGFYSELARNAAYGDWLAIYLLRLDGRPVAFHFSLTWRGRYYLLKPGYDESIKECSPGQLLVDEVMEDCLRRGFTEFDFLGPDMPWKREWGAIHRPHFWLFVFRNSRYGRALRDYKFKWIPAVKRVMARGAVVKARVPEGSA